MTLRVLYVDDDRINSLLFEQACRVAEVPAVALAECSAEALELAPRFKPDLLVIDLHLPDADGFMLLASLRQTLRQPALPAYLCTADETPGLPARAAAAGFAGCWRKPVMAEVLRAALANQQDGVHARPNR